MQFPHMEVKIAIDALECSNFSYFLLAHLPSSPPLNTSPDLHILHLLDEFMKGTSRRAGEQTTPLDLICVLSSSYLIVFLWRKTVKKENKEPFASILQIVSMKQRQHDREQNKKLFFPIIELKPVICGP